MGVVTTEQQKVILEQVKDYIDDNDSKTGIDFTYNENNKELIFIVKKGVSADATISSI